MKKIFDYYFGHPTLEKLIEDELAEARRSLLRAQTAVEYATATVYYHEARIARLESHPGRKVGE